MKSIEMLIFARVQGFLHGSYSIGASLGPLIAGTMISVGKTPWYYWFYVLVSL